MSCFGGCASSGPAFLLLFHHVAQRERAGDLRVEQPGFLSQVPSHVLSMVGFKGLFTSEWGQKVAKPLADRSSNGALLSQRRRLGCLLASLGSEQELVT